MEEEHIEIIVAIAVKSLFDGVSPNDTAKLIAALVREFLRRPQ